MTMIMICVRACVLVSVSDRRINVLTVDDIADIFQSVFQYSFALQVRVVVFKHFDLNV